MENRELSAKSCSFLGSNRLKTEIIQKLHRKRQKQNLDKIVIVRTGPYLYFNI